MIDIRSLLKSRKKYAIKQILRTPVSVDWCKNRFPCSTVLITIQQDYWSVEWSEWKSKRDGCGR